MIKITKAAERGHSRFDWINSYHTFSFGRYHEPRRLGVSNLRVINDDRVVPGGRSATHGHHNMEIVNYVLSGTLEHCDSRRNGSCIRPGDVHLMSAGTGVAHSEFNPSGDIPVHFLQFWFLPNRPGVKPAYSQKSFSEKQRRGRLVPLISPDGRDGSLGAHQDGLMYGTLLEPGDHVEHLLGAGRTGWVHVAKGSARVNGKILEAGDGAEVEGNSEVLIEGVRRADVLLFDLP